MGYYIHKFVKKGMKLMTENLNQIMDTTLDKIKSMVDANTIVGDPITNPAGITIVPISRVSFGFFSGGGEYNSKKEKKQQEADSSCDLPFASGTGAGVTLQPIAFIVIDNTKATMLPVNYNSTIERIMEAFPEMIGNLKENIKS